MPEARGSLWRRAAGFAVAAIAVLAALIAVRGPDAIGLDTASAIGAWRLSGSLFDPLAPFAVLAEFPFRLFGLGLRGWQNAHVVIAWAAALCWLWPLPQKSWAGLMPLVPALLAACVSDSLSGLSPFGASVLLLSAWRLINRDHPEKSWLTLPPAAWLAAWIFPGSIPFATALFLEASAGWTRRRAAACASLGLAALCLTPRGLRAWGEAYAFLAHFPQPALGASAVAAVLVSLAVLAVTLWAGRALAPRGTPFAAAFLFLCAAQGQSAYLWTAALAMIPCWEFALEALRGAGLRVRWYARLALVIAAGLLVVPAASAAWPRWYDLAMTSALVRPTLTKDALPTTGAIYVNPGGLPLAAFSGPLSTRVTREVDPRLAREPSLWRAHDRQARYGAVWLLGDKSDYAPLARHLGESPDWRLEAVDATGLLFVRANSSPEFATESAAQFARQQGAAANRGNFMAAAGLSCLAAGAIPEASELTKLAARQAPESANAAAARTAALVAAGDLRGALTASENAIELGPASSAAWQARSEALLRSGQVDEASAAALRAAELSPADAGVLWLAARAANASRAFQLESEILENLVAQTRGRGGDIGFYALYLGQSYARQGLARPALHALQEAAKTPGLTPKQQEDLRSQIEEIQSASHQP